MKSPLLNIAYKWAGILASCLILLNLINYILGIDNLKGGLSIALQLFWWIIIIVCLVFSGIEYRKKHLNGFMKYGQAFGLGILISLFSSIVFSLFNYIFYQFIDHDAFLKTMQYAIEEIDKNANIPAEMKENMILRMLDQTPLLSSIQYLITSNIITLIFMLIIAIFTKKKNSSFEETFKDVM